MARETTRRGFLGLSAAGLTAPVAPLELLWPATAVSTAVSENQKENSNVSPEISVWVTSGDQRFAAAPRATWRPATQEPATDQLRLSPGTKYQQMLGFGGAFT